MSNFIYKHRRQRLKLGLPKRGYMAKKHIEALTAELELLEEYFIQPINK